MNTSIVIPLGTGSRWGNLELKFALRSVEKHLSGYGEVFIVGECPGWLQNVIHIPAKDGDQIYDKERNIFNKIMIACNDDLVTHDFLFMNDDHFLLQDYVAGEFPLYCDGWLSDHVNRVDLYGNSAQNTSNVLHQDPPYFDIHCPIVYHKALFKRILPCYDWSVKWGYCIKTLYCHQVATHPTPYPDLKINELLPVALIKEQLAGRAWFSIGDRAREGGILQVLQELYPTPSKYEKTKR